jgi:nucleotide-binding universal stress UspA family protein
MAGSVKRIAVAFDGSDESKRALREGCMMSRALGVALLTVTVMEPLPSYSAYAAVADGSVLRILQEDRDRYYGDILSAARAQAQSEGCSLETSLATGDVVDAIAEFVASNGVQLLVVGLHHREMRIARIWSTAYAIAQQVHCNILGVH